MLVIGFRRSALTLAKMTVLAAVIAAGCDGGRMTSSESDASTCDAPFLVCSDRCVDVSSDELNCGACGSTCAAGYRCSGGKCALSCPKTQSACGLECATLDS